MINDKELPMNATQKISFRILTLVNEGCDLKVAFDKVLGEGKYDSFVSDLYDALRAKAV
jgi:hypothetical protein